ncbi:MAG: pyrimidine/purine nucleoside phosphorylase [Cloacibacillus sp.]
MIEKLENVTAVAKANVYFDGKVVSHTVFMPNGDRKTLGLFLPGEYEFGVGDSEIMDITDGVCQVKMPGADGWMDVKAGESFTLPADSKYGFRCYVPVQYLCSYIKA